MPRPIPTVAFDISVNSIGDDMLVPQVGVKLEVRPSTRQRMAKPMMKKDVIHPVLPAQDAIVGLKCCLTEAALVQFWWVYFIEMRQTMKNPFLVIRICEILEAKQEVERTF